MTVEILLARGYEAIGNHFNIPESNDAVPDILNEATWEVMWMLKMQKADGGVFNKLASETWEYGAAATSELGGQNVRFFMERTTQDTATTGAVFAMASRSWRAYNATLSAVLMHRALLAWDFLEQHPITTPAGGFTNPPGHISGPYPDTNDDDNRAWLAAELYRATCNFIYGDYYIQFIADAGNIVALGGNDFVDYRYEAAWAFYFATCANEPETYAFVRRVILGAMKSAVSGNKNMATRNPYKNVGRLDVPEWVGWGSSGAVNWAHFVGVLGWHMFGDESQLDWMSASLDAVLGANPLAMSFVTGLGRVYPMDPTQGQSRTDDVVEPIPGYPVMGPFAHVSFKSPYFAVAQGDRANYPSMTQVTSPYPILRRWSDANELPQYNEGGVGPVSYLCGAFQILAASAYEFAAANSEG